MTNSTEKLALEMSSDMLAELRLIAQRESRPLPALIEEAVGGWLDERKRAQPRPHVMQAYLGSQDRFGELYRLLA